MTDSLDWQQPYRSMDASGAPDTAEAVGRTWIETLAQDELRHNGFDGLSIENSAAGADGCVIALYRGTKLLAASTIFRDPMNFAVLLRWKAAPERA